MLEKKINMVSWEEAKEIIDKHSDGKEIPEESWICNIGNRTNPEYLAIDYSEDDFYMESFAGSKMLAIAWIMNWIDSEGNTNEENLWCAGAKINWEMY